MAEILHDIVKVATIEALNVTNYMGISMVWCTHFVLKLKVHIISKLFTNIISLILDYSKNHI
jgi:hypothetical protein